MESEDYAEANSDIQSLFKDILLGIERIERVVTEKIEPVRKQLEQRAEYDLVVKYGLEGFKDKIIKSCNEKTAFDPQAWVIKTIQKDSSLRFPHRKILEYLSRQYDYEKKAFKEANHSAIVKECRIGKNKASKYLKHLEGMGCIEKRHDGYRVWYRIKN